MQREEYKESLLTSEEDLSFKEDVIIPRRRPSSLPNTRAFLAISCILVLSLALNFYHGFQSYLSLKQPGPGFVKRPSYTGLKYHKPITYHAHTDFWGKNETLADELWESLSTDAVTIAVDKDLAARKGLPLSDTFYWDTDKSLYHIKAIHDVHCLKVIRHINTQSKRQGTPISSTAIEHVYHCLDALRQDIMCAADDTLMPSVEKGGLGNNQVMQCRDWDELVQWATDPERDSCYRMVNDYKKVANDLERHAFCKEDSQYRPTMKAYFDIHGHRNMFKEHGES